LLYFSVFSFGGKNGNSKQFLKIASAYSEIRKYIDFYDLDLIGYPMDAWKSGYVYIDETEEKTQMNIYADRINNLLQCIGRFRYDAEKSKKSNELMIILYNCKQADLPLIQHLIDISEDRGDIVDAQPFSSYEEVDHFILFKTKSLKEIYQDMNT
jgi:hypothetical protein